MIIVHDLFPLATVTFTLPAQSRNLAAACRIGRKTGLIRGAGIPC
jgi:hypothetical protein